MTTIHYLAGLPRSGSTLLGNLLAQHEDISVTGTSPLVGCVQAVRDVISNNPEVIGQLEHGTDTYDRYLNSIRQMMQAWHADKTTPVVLDKHRLWTNMGPLVSQLDEDSQIICCVRDPRDIIASFEKQERNTALFNSPVDKHLYDYASKTMAPDGMVGMPLKLVEDVIRRRLPVIWVQYEDFIRDPQPFLDDIVEQMGLAPNEWDFENIVNVSEDMDSVYRNKYPHIGAGALRTPAGSWRDVMNDELGELIASVSPLLMQTFRYT